MKTILVTGAGGYIGTRLVPALLNRGHAVRAVDRYFFGDDLLDAHDNLEIIRADTRHLPAAHFDRVNAVVDLVAISNETCGEQFKDATWQINCHSRVRTATLAKEHGATQYILPSSASVYGVQPKDAVCLEEGELNPQTAYAKANRSAEQQSLALADGSFTATVLRQATVFGHSPRIRLDLAINYMVWQAWEVGRVPVVRDGSQWRPFVHVDDAVAAQMFMLETADRSAINGQIFNVGASSLNLTALGLGELIQANIPKPVELEWIGDPDTRSYNMDCDKIATLGWAPQRTIPETVARLWKMFESGELKHTPQMHTLRWYGELNRWHKIIREVAMYDGILDIRTEVARGGA